jgi:magnesium chelatase family protein
MVSRINTVAFNGIEAIDINVQVSISPGIPAINIVGLPDKAVGESKERIRSALNALGMALPAKRITINLAPADVIKEGSHYDLPIALGLLVGLGVLPKDEMLEYLALGELALDGALAPVSGVLPAAIKANSKSYGLICPKECGSEAAWASPDLSILAPAHLLELINHFKGTQVLSRPEPKLYDSPAPLPDLKEVKGQETAKRALEVAAAGGHNMLMIGPPGSGKSMLSQRLPSILPDLTPEQALEVSMIKSLTGGLDHGKIVRQRPFRAPHHSASLPAMVGGGSNAKPGEISLAHNGILFLDELPEFSRQTLEALRQPLESGVIHVSRVNAHICYPANLQLIAAMNPCRCGYLGDPALACNRAPRCAVDYQGKISGPILDRIDLHVEISAVKIEDLTLPAPEESSADVKKRVEAARAIQLTRYAHLNNIKTNAEVGDEFLRDISEPDNKGRQILSDAAERLSLSARGYHRILRIARTIADLDASESVSYTHISEALTYRRLSMHNRMAA